MKGRVLIIDDEAEIRRNLSVGLIQEDYAVITCPNGISAVHELNNAEKSGLSYDYLITDIFMPDIDGLKILKVIKQQHPDLPVLVITGFGDDRLKFTALSENNTGYLDKPFEIPDLVAALNKLSPGSTQITAVSAPKDVIHKTVSSYLTIRITDTAGSMEIFNQLYSMEGVVSCEAVSGEYDIIILAQAESQDMINTVFDKISNLKGVEIVSMAEIERPKLDREINEFIRIYSEAVKKQEQDEVGKQPGAASYIIVDIDENAIQQIFTTVFFIDEVVFCDVVDGGKKLIGMITNQGITGRTPKIIEKLSQIDGVLRVRETKVIKLLEY